MIDRCDHFLGGFEFPLFGSSSLIVLSSTHVEQGMGHIGRLGRGKMHFSRGELGRFCSLPLFVLALGLNHHLVNHINSKI